MNAKRRKELQALGCSLSDLRADIDGRLGEIRDKLEAIRDAEQECVDNTPENLQLTERYENSCNAVDCIENALASIDDAVVEIESAVE